MKDYIVRVDRGDPFFERGPSMEVVLKRIRQNIHSIYPKDQAQKVSIFIISAEHYKSGLGK